MLPNDGQQESKFDAFQYYSSDLLRLKTHLLSSNHDDDELSVLARVNGINNSEPIKKQNEAVIQPQLSWEVHPSLLLHDLDEDGEDIHFISDDEDEHII